MRSLTKRNLIIALVVVLLLSAMAAVSAFRFGSDAANAADGRADDAETDHTIEYNDSENGTEIADNGPDADAGDDLRAVLVDESQDDVANAIVWPDGIWGSEDPQDADPEEPPVNPEPEQPRQLLNMDVTYSLDVAVVDAGGYPVEGAEVIVGENSFFTDALGQVTVVSDEPGIELIVAADGYVSYYDEYDLSERTLPVTVTMSDADSIRLLLDSAELRPYRSDNSDLNSFLDVLFADLFRPGMDTYDKVKACYDWLIEHTYYRSPNHWDTAKNYWLCAYQLLLDGYGTCNCYSAAFTAMMRHIGLDCYVVTGYTTANEGGYTGHDWTTVCINDRWYIFDPQVEDAIAGRTRSKEVTYVRFCLEEPHSKYRYSVSSRANCVKKFQKYLDEHGVFVAD